LTLLLFTLLTVFTRLSCTTFLFGFAAFDFDFEHALITVITVVTLVYGVTGSGFISEWLLQDRSQGRERSLLELLIFLNRPVTVKHRRQTTSRQELAALIAWLLKPFLTI